MLVTWMYPIAGEVPQQQNVKGQNVTVVNCHSGWNVQWKLRVGRNVALSVREWT